MMAGSNNMGEIKFSDAAQRRALAADLKEFNFAVHQPEDPPNFTKEPESVMQPAHWKAGDIAHWLKRLSTDIKLEPGGQRRTLRLANPGIRFGTTPTLWASIQYIHPGEIATAHRHTANALRFIMKGFGADTIVDGEKYEFNEGDLVLTPNWAFHDHEHKGNEPMIWLDVLDISLVQKMEAVFFEASDTARRPVNVIADASFREFGSGLMRPARPRHAYFENPLLVYPKARAEEAVMQASGLAPDPFDDTALEYCNPRNGEPALPTIGTILQRLRPGICLKSQRHTGSSVYYVIRGVGRSTVGNQTFNWGPGDFFAIPPWAIHSHMNTSQADAAWFFHVNDFPAIRKLGLWREWKQP